MVLSFSFCRFKWHVGQQVQGSSKPAPQSRAICPKMMQAYHVFRA
jgi:hypothetical protein